MIAVLASMEREISAIRKVRSNETYLGEAKFHITGVGRDKVHAFLAGLDGCDSKPAGIVSMGYAAALKENLEPGDLIITRSLCATGEEVRYETDASLLSQVQGVAEEIQPTRYQVAGSVTVQGVATSRAEKRLLAAITSASIANMEDYWVAQWAHERSIPYISIRSVLDTLSQDVPEFISGLAGMKLPIQVIGVAIQGLVRPEKLKSVMRLFKEERVARRSLKEFGTTFLSGVSEPARHVVT